MRVLIAGQETCGVIHDVKTELMSRGHEVVSIATCNRFFDHKADFDQQNLPLSWLSRRMSLSLSKLLLKTLWHARCYERFEAVLRRRFVRWCDMYLQVCAGIQHQGTMLREARLRRISSGVMLMGSDVRDYNVFSKQYSVGNWVPPPERTAQSMAAKVSSLREVEKYASAVFSVPDQMGLALRPYYHLRIPLVLNRFKPYIPKREVPRVLHAPSNSSLKGTETIERVLAQLRDAGIRFDYVRLQGLKNREVLQALSEADVLVDELILHGPGWLSMEALASGCAVATRYLQNSPACFRPPVVAIDHQNIYDGLRTLLSSVEERIRLANAGLEFVRGNAIGLVVDDLVDKTMKPQAYPADYKPTYVWQCDWSPSERSQLQLDGSDLSAASQLTAC